MSVSTMERALRAADCQSQFMKVCRDIVDSAQHVRIDRKALETYAANLRKPDFIPGWDDYVTPRNKSLWARTDDFIELAVSTSINAGYLYADAEGVTRKWELNGSGAAALVQTMNAVRNAGTLPALDLKSSLDVRWRLSDIFNGVPFADHRLAIWVELADPKVTKGLRDLLYSTREKTASKQHHFSFDHLMALRSLSPKGFGEDPFLKKAALLPILFAGLAHNKIAPDSVTLGAFAAADYRVPQTNHNLGQLRFSDELVDRLESETLMAEDDPMVMEIRAATWVTEVDTLTLRPDLQAHHLDGEKWFAGRLFDKRPDQLDEKKQRMRGRLESIGQTSGFDEPGFMRRATKPMAVATMRF